MTGTISLSGSLMNLSTGTRRTAIHKSAIGIAIAAILFGVLLVSLQRTHFGIFAESDFTGSFGPEAKRILAGIPLLLEFHPPGYAFAVALWRVVVDDWLGAGLWISGLSTAIFLIASVVTFRRLAGPAAAWGALIACACSTLFFTMASTASSDMLFAALVALMFALVVLAMDTPNGPLLWLLTGIVAACVLLTRTNGLVAALVLIAPMLAPAQVSGRLRNLGAVVAGFLLPLFAWALYAVATHSPLMPSGTHLNLAVSVFGNESEAWGDRVTSLEHEFGNIIDVVAHNPALVISRLTQRVLALPSRLSRSLTWLPLVVLAVPGILYMLWRGRSPAFLLLLSICAGITVLSGLVEFQARYHLILIPVIGAMAALTCDLLVSRFASRTPVRIGISICLILVATVVSARAYAPTLSILEIAMQREIAEAIPHVLRRTEVQATIYARKSNLAFETGRKSRLVANASSAFSLHREFCSELKVGEPAYLYLGQMERQYRSKLSRDLSAARPPAWLEPIAHGVKADWSLYRIRLFSPDAQHDQACSTQESYPGD